MSPSPVRAGGQAADGSHRPEVRFGGGHGGGVDSAAVVPRRGGSRRRFSWWWLRAAGFHGGSFTWRTLARAASTAAASLSGFTAIAITEAIAMPTAHYRHHFHGASSRAVLLLLPARFAGFLTYTARAGLPPAVASPHHGARRVLLMS